MKELVVLNSAERRSPINWAPLLPAATIQSTPLHHLSPSISSPVTSRVTRGQATAVTSAERQRQQWRRRRCSTRHHSSRYHSCKSLLWLCVGVFLLLLFLHGSYYHSWPHLYCKSLCRIAFLLANVLLVLQQFRLNKATCASCLLNLPFFLYRIANAKRDVAILARTANFSFLFFFSLLVRFPKLLMQQLRISKRFPSVKVCDLPSFTP
jgi:hypothetical protein